MDYKYIPFYVQGNAINGFYYGQWNQMSDRDIDYVKEMYPIAFMTIQDWVERECDKQEFAGSLMFDEYPDKLGVLQMVNNIFRLVKEEEEQCGDGENCIKYPDDQWLKDIIMVLLLNEMYRRRQNRRRYY